jgi:thermostable 8-oxoguanine DNA glycosylase
MMLRRVALVRTDVSEEHIATKIRVTGIGEGAKFLRNVGSYKSHTA